MSEWSDQVLEKIQRERVLGLPLGLLRMEIRADRMCAFARLELHRLVRRSQAHFPGPVAGAGVGLPEQASDTVTQRRV